MAIEDFPLLLLSIISGQEITDRTSVTKFLLEQGQLVTVTMVAMATCRRSIVSK